MLQRQWAPKCVYIMVRCKFELKPLYFFFKTTTHTGARVVLPMLTPRSNFMIVFCMFAKTGGRHPSKGGRGFFHESVLHLLHVTIMCIYTFSLRRLTLNALTWRARSADFGMHLAMQRQVQGSHRRCVPCNASEPALNPPVQTPPVSR